MNKEPPIKPLHLHYPWPGALALLVTLIVWLLARQPVILPQGALLKPLPEPVLWSITGVALLLVCFDLVRFRRRLQRLNAHNQGLAELCQQLLDEKKLLQQKAHTFANQTDKLKAFIGDKLLEYIEYDEKFLHFKGIAAEVRHNGIISYDIVMAALQRARESAPDQRDYAEAIASLGYLWDLLDLSTADNMALHINNHLCECENYFYQQQLQGEQAAPFEPVFHIHTALLRALAPLTDAQERLQWANHDHALICQHPGNRFRFHLSKHALLLGNENHLVLLAENLLKNALYYRQQSEDPRTPIVLQLQADTETARLVVYNPGPTIDEALQQKIYQLGFSTRDNSHDQDPVHGRGLGLYFVGQIIAGYEGQIQHRNYRNAAESYSLRIETHDGLAGQRVQTQVVDVVEVDGQPQCRLEHASEAGGQQTVPELAWQFNQAIVSVEVTAKSRGITHGYYPIDAHCPFLQQEPGDGEPPRWQLEIIHEGGRGRLVFSPLNVTGVAFTVTLPLAQSEQGQWPGADSGDYLEEIASKYLPLG